MSTTNPLRGMRGRARPARAGQRFRSDTAATAGLGSFLWASALLLVVPRPAWAIPSPDVVTGAFVPHHLQATVHDACLRPPTGTLVLGPPPGRTNFVYKPGMCAVGGVVFGVFVCTGFTVGPAIKRGKALTFPP